MLSTNWSRWRSFFRCSIVFSLPFFHFVILYTTCVSCSDCTVDRVSKHRKVIPIPNFSFCVVFHSFSFLVFFLLCLPHSTLLLNHNQDYRWFCHKTSTCHEFEQTNSILLLFGWAIKICSRSFLKANNCLLWLVAIRIYHSRLIWT